MILSDGVGRWGWGMGGGGGGNCVLWDRLGQLPAGCRTNESDPRGARTIWSFVNVRSRVSFSILPASLLSQSLPHSFYRIPNGESGADVYDRLSTFIDTLHRAFKLPRYPSKCIIITHGLLIRLFLTRWFHLPYEHYEAMENLGHCERVVMELQRGKYRLVTELRMWKEVGPKLEMGWERQLGESDNEEDEMGEERTASLTSTDDNGPWKSDEES